MPNTTDFSFGDVVLVVFPFTDQQGSKQRPAVVVSSADYQRNRPDVILMAITSQVRPLLAFGEALIHNWQGAGLLKTSVLKPIVFTTEKALVRKTLGRLIADDQVSLRKVLGAVIG